MINIWEPLATIYNHADPTQNHRALFPANEVGLR